MNILSQSINKHNEELLSRIFSYLRFPLIIAVVFIHNFAIGENMTDNDFEKYPICYYTMNLFSNVLCRTAVPIFFFMSGYLFFRNASDYNILLYISKLKKRFKTLFNSSLKI